FLLQAWVAEHSAKEVGEGLSKACNGLASMYVDEESKNHGESPTEDPASTTDADPPTLVKAPSWTRPLQSIIDNFGIPSYGETSPLPFMILTFPLIYRLSFGDIGDRPLFLALGIDRLYLMSNQATVL